MVDVLPWAPPGNYSNIVVQGNHINGGFATGVSPTIVSFPTIYVPSVLEAS